MPRRPHPPLNQAPPISYGHLIANPSLHKSMTFLPMKMSHDSGCSWQSILNWKERPGNYAMLRVSFTIFSILDSMNCDNAVTLDTDWSLRWTQQIIDGRAWRMDAIGWFHRRIDKVTSLTGTLLLRKHQEKSLMQSHLSIKANEEG